MNEVEMILAKLQKELMGLSIARQAWQKDFSMH